MRGLILRIEPATRVLRPFVFNRALAVSALTAAAFFAAAWTGRWGGNWPEPHVHDEFSYLLSADTFAHGRLSNPPLPYPEHFENFYVLQSPRYASAYPPMQGLFLAAGQRLFGHPATGLWIASACMVGAVSWALYACLPAPWAFFGGLWTLGRYGLFTYWTHSYWGGAVPAFAGALVLGVFLRTAGPAGIRHGLILGAALTMLANSRPFEGALFAVCAGVLAAGGFRPPRRFWIALAAALAAGAAATGVYNRDVGGNALRPPVMRLQQTQSSVPIFFWQPLNPDIRYREGNRTAAPFEKATRRVYQEKRTVKGFFSFLGESFGIDVRFYWGFGGLALCLAALIVGGPGRGTLARLLAALGIYGFASSAPLSFHTAAHYVSPAAVLFVLALVTAVRRAASAAPRFLAGALLAAWAVSAASDTAVDATAHARIVQARPQGRAKIEAILSRRPGPHLIFVSDESGRQLNDEWIYNGAELNEQPMIWARDLGPEANARLTFLFPNRERWLVEHGRDAVLVKL